MIIQSSGGTSTAIPEAGTDAGDQRRAHFQSDLLDILGDTRYFWMPAKADTTTTTGSSRNASTITYSESLADFDSGIVTLGSGVAVDFNGSDEEGDTNDAANLSFGDGTNDQPFSVLALVYPDVVDTVMTIVAKSDETSGSELREYWFYMDGSGYPSFEIFDESANAIIGREDQTALTAATWTLLAGTYDGSGAVTGINIYKDAALVDDNNAGTTGTYVGMENTATKVQLAFHTGASAAEEFWNGRLALVAVVAKELSADEVWKLKKLVNGFYDLTL